MDGTSAEMDIRKTIRSHLILSLFLLSVLTVLFLSVYTRVLLVRYMDSEEYNIVQRLKALSISAASFADGDELDSFRTVEDMDLPAYRKLREDLRRFSGYIDVLYVYYIRIVDGKVQYIVDNDFDEKTRVGLDTPLTDTVVEEGVERAIEGQVVCEGIGNYTEGWEGLMSAYAPIYNTRGVIVAVAGVDIKDDPILSTRKRMAILTGIQIFSVVFVLTSGIVCLLGYRRAASHADAANRSKSFFLARMSHEIRTPMNVIIGLSELAQRESGIPDKALQYIASIKNAGVSLLAIINDILDFSKIESGKLVLDPVPYETASMLDEVLRTIRIRLAEKPVELTIDIDHSLPASLVGDMTRVRQILLNMLSNAVKYTEKGFIRFTVSWKEMPDDTALLTFSVTDSGIGIRGEDMPHLFGDFVRVEEQRNKSIEGTGLGLAITRRLCQAMKGEVKAESEYGKGSIFTVTLPQAIRDRQPVGDVEHTATVRMETQRIPFTTPEADILLVDDLPSNLLVGEGLLALYKARIFTCRSGNEAVELVHSRSFDLVFMDHMMPGMDGLEATAAIRAMDGRGEMPIIALTANAVSGMKEMFLKNGFSDFLSKPIEFFDLAKIMEKWIPMDKRGKAPDGSMSVGVESASLPVIEGVDVLGGFAHTGGSPSRYLNLLEMFCRDARTRLPLLEKRPEEGERKVFTTQMHALKSALASIGATDLATVAANLEEAGRSGDMSAIHDTLYVFHNALESLLKRIDAALSQARPADDRPGGERRVEKERELLAQLKDALEQEDIDAMDKALEALKALSLASDMRDALSSIAECMLSADFTKAATELEIFLRREA